MIPWLKQRDIAILGSDHPQYVSPSNLRGAVHDFALLYLGVHLFDNCDLEALGRRGGRPQAVGIPADGGAAPDSRRDRIAAESHRDVLRVVPMKRGGSPGEVAAAILWLLSEEASYTTGAFIDVAGGK